MSIVQAELTMIDFDRDTALTKKMLDALDMRVRASMHNIANQNTPGFKRYVVRFEELLREKLADGDDGSVQDVEPLVERDTTGDPGQNTVSMVDETATLDKARLVFDVMTRRAGSLFKLMNSAVFGR
jgi:flagellar basal-body rod protein FlgB